MKRSKILLGLLLFINWITQSNAQSSDKTGYVVLNVGIASPSINFSDPDVGGATGGQTFQLSIAVPVLKTVRPKVKSHFGLVGKINYSTYGMTNQPLIARQLAVMKKFNLDSDVTFVEKTNYKTNQLSFLGGGYITFPIGDFSIDGRAICGPTIMTRPEIWVDVPAANSNFTTYTDSKSTRFTFAYDLGISFRYNLLESKKLCVMLNVDYSMTRLNYKFNSDSMYIDDLGFLREGDHEERIRRRVAYLDATFGVGYVW